MKSRIRPVIFLAVLCAASAAVLYHAPQTHPGMAPEALVRAVAATPATPSAIAPLPRIGTAHAALPAQSGQVSPGATPRVVESYGRLPLAFEANAGQTDAQVKFISRGRGYTMFLTGDEAVLSLQGGSQKAKGKKQMAKVDGHARTLLPPLLPLPDSLASGATHNPQPATRALPFANLQSSIGTSRIPNPESPTPAVLRMKLLGANVKAKVTGAEPLPGKSNYFIGNDPKKWRTNVPSYAKVKYNAVYPGIDLVYYGNQRQLEYDFVVAPGADPKAIAFDVAGATRRVGQAGRGNASPLHIDPAGDLVISTDGGDVRLHKPVVYQPMTSALNPKSKIENPKSIDGRFVLLADNRVGFEVANYDKTQPLVIDPVLSYATYLGGTGEELGLGIAVDASGNAYVTGSTFSTDFPPNSGGYQGNGDAFLTKLSPDGSALLFSTYFGGATQRDLGVAVSVSPSSGSPYITGLTWSDDFPTTTGAYDTTFNSPGVADAFVAKLSGDDGALLYSTFLGGAGDDEGFALAVDATGAAYVTGRTDSPGFPTKNAHQGTFGGGLSCGDFFSGFYACPDAFVTKINPGGLGTADLIYSTFLGKAGWDAGGGIAVDSFGNAYVTGFTPSSDFVAVSSLQPYAGGFDGFVLRLSPSGLLLYSTFLGGTLDEYPQSLAINAGNIYVTGMTYSSDFPTQSASQPSLAGDADGFVTVFPISEALGQIDFSTYLGGTGKDVPLGIAPDSSGNIFVSGETLSSDFPTAAPVQANSGGGADAFVTKFPAGGGAPVFSTYLGGSGDEDVNGAFIAVDSGGNVYVTGDTTGNFPTANAYQSTFGGVLDAYVAKISFPIAPGVSLSPASLNFGDQAVGFTSSPKTVWLTNSGTLPLTISSIALNTGTDFAETHDDCPISPTTLPGGEYCEIDVTFTPTTTGTLTDEVVITSDAVGIPPHLDLTGVGVPPSPRVNLSVDELEFTDQLVDSPASDPQSLLLTNTGTAPLEIFSVTGTSEFIVDNHCPLSPLTIDINISCTINASFAPTTRGTHTGKITISDNTAELNHYIFLAGVGIIPATADLSATSRDFGETLLTKTSQQSVILTNNGDLALTIASVVAGPVGGDFSVASNTCGVELARAANCTIGLNFAPTATGAREGTLTITSQPVSPPVVALTGKGTEFAVVIPAGEDPKTVTAGTGASYSLQINPTGYVGNIALACAFQGTTPRGASCSVSPASVAANGTDPSPFTVNVPTTARSGAVPQFDAPRAPLDPKPWARHIVPLLLGLILLAAVAALGARPDPVGERRTGFASHRPALQWAPLAATLLFVLLWAACGGSTTTTKPPTGTPAGTYKINLNATASGVTKTQVLTVIVN